MLITDIASNISVDCNRMVFEFPLAHFSRKFSFLYTPLNKITELVVLIYELEITCKAKLGVEKSKPNI